MQELGKGGSAGMTKRFAQSGKACTLSPPGRKLAHGLLVPQTRTITGSFAKFARAELVYT